IYGADETDFTGAIEDIIAALQAAGGSPQETGIFLAAFAEVVDLFEVAASLSNDALRSVQWYGSDSVALLPDLVENADAAGFAMVVGYPNPILGLRDEDESLWGPVLEDLEEELDRRPDTFALAAYDALVVAHMALEEAGADADAAEFAQAFVS